jgi:hypothetical protein
MKRVTATYGKPEVESGEWLQGAEPSKVSDITPTPALTMQVEDANVDLFAELLSAGTHDVVLLDNHTIGLVVDGELRATYIKESVYRKGSVLGQARLEKAAREAAELERVALGFGRTTGSAGAVPASVDEKPAEKKDATSGIEKFIGPSLHATEAELAAVGHIPKANSQFQEDLEVPVIRPDREVVEGND